jgi:hypothetical protein
MNDSNHKIPAWLKLIQENSWELELLISGGAIFSLFQLSGSWINWIESTNEFANFQGRTEILLLGTLGIEILKIGFITHIILRALWLSMVCVNYVYPQGIQKEKITWKRPFKNDIQDNEDLQFPIIKIDRYCGIVIYLSISSAIMLMGIIFCIFLFLSIPSILGWKYADGLYIYIVVLCLILYVIDLFTAGLLRKIPYFTYITYPIFSILDVLSLRMFIQKSGFLFFTNIPKLKFFSAMFVMLSIGIVMSYINTYSRMHWPNIFDARGYTYQLSSGMDVAPRYYRDETVSRYRGNPSIQSKILHDNFIDLFIPYNVEYDLFLDGLDKKLENRLLSDIASFSIDSVEINGIQWHESWQESKNGISRHIGIECFIPIGHLNDGIHILKIYTDPILQKQIEKNVELTKWDKEKFNKGLEILFIKDTQLSIGQQPIE